MSSPRFKKDKEIIVEYESQVKGKRGTEGGGCLGCSIVTQPVPRCVTLHTRTSWFYRTTNFTNE